MRKRHWGATDWLTFHDWVKENYPYEYSCYEDVFEHYDDLYDFLEHNYWGIIADWATRGLE